MLNSDLEIIKIFIRAAVDPGIELIGHHGGAAHPCGNRKTTFRYSGNPPCGHFVNTATSLLRPHLFGPEKWPYIVS